MNKRLLSMHVILLTDTRTDGALLGQFILFRYYIGPRCPRTIEVAEPISVL